MTGRPCAIVSLIFLSSSNSSSSQAYHCNFIFSFSAKLQCHSNEREETTACLQLVFVLLNISFLLLLLLFHFFNIATYQKILSLNKISRSLTVTLFNRVKIGTIAKSITLLEFVHVISCSDRVEGPQIFTTHNFLYGQIVAFAVLLAFLLFNLSTLPFLLIFFISILLQFLVLIYFMVYDFFY